MQNKKNRSETTQDTNGLQGPIGGGEPEHRGDREHKARLHLRAERSEESGDWDDAVRSQQRNYLGQNRSKGGEVRQSKQPQEDVLYKRVGAGNRKSGQ